MMDEIFKIKSALAKNAVKVDKENRFPAENIKLFKDSGLTNFLVPPEFGGLGGSLIEAVKIARILGSACLSSAMIWAMHCQQITCIINHASADFKRNFLKRMAANSYLIGSITTERTNSGSILNSLSPIVYLENGLIEINRDAPIVTGGNNCDGYLVTMKATLESPESDVKLVYIDKDQAEIKITSETIDMLGMRGTNSIGLTLSGQVSIDQIINLKFSFDDIAYNTMIPVGHILWSSCWLGCFIASFENVIKIVKGIQKNIRFNINSELIMEKIARARMEIDVVSSFINDALIEYTEYFTTSKDKLRLPCFIIKINNLKIYSSETLFKSICELIELVGIRFGYIKGVDNNLERAFRDLRSAALMINNDKLLVSNGRLSLFDKSLF